MTLRLIAANHRRLIRPALPAKTAWSVRTKSTRPQPFFDTANSILESLRWKAANALTASLSADQRKELLEQLRPVQTSTSTKDDDDQTTQHSIAEAVAAARAAESQRHEQKWEREKETIMAQAAAAAQARVESDLAIQKRRLAFERWKEQLEQEKQQNETDQTQTAVVVNNIEEEEDDAHHHPVLGPVVIDLGYKRVHVVSAQALASIPVWKKQRIYRHDRAKSMAADKLKTLHLGMPGVIGLHEDKKGKLSILDGQHRVGMMTILEEKDASLDLERILVEVYPQQLPSSEDHHDDNHAKELFLEVNKAEPVKLVDMPGVAKSADRKIINDGAARLQNSFPDMFSPSQKCRAPHLNIDNLRDALFAANVISRNELKTSKGLEDWMLAQNKLLAAKYCKNGKEAQTKSTTVSKAALAKANKFGFYLGLEASWLYN